MCSGLFCWPRLSFSVSPTTAPSPVRPALPVRAGKAGVTPALGRAVWKFKAVTHIQAAGRRGSALPHNHIMPKQGNPFLGCGPVIFGTAPKRVFAIQELEELRLAKRRDDFAFILEPREKPFCIS